jgi:predicted nuclease with TOPRIM domain
VSSTLTSCIVTEDLTLDPDELMADLREHQKHLRDLLMESKKHSTDIDELQDELDRLADDISTDDDDSISPEPASG